MVFNKKPAQIALALLLVEVAIACFVHDRFIRPYIGDYLVVILLYFLVKTFTNIPPLKAMIYVLIFAYVVEFLQYLHIADLPLFKHSRLALIIIGNTFSWQDMALYTAGIATLALGYFFGKKSKNFNDY